MRQAEFLKELEESLCGKLGHEEIQDILADYAGFFASGMEEGRTEDEVSRELGSPAMLAKSLLGEGAPPEQAADPGKRIIAFIIDAAIASLPAICVMLAAVRIFPVLLLLLSPSPGAGVASFWGISAYSHTESVVRSYDAEGNLIGENKSKSGSGPHPAVSAAAVLSIMFYIGYGLISTVVWKGQTIGKKLLRIRVTRMDGGKAGSSALVSRELLGKVVMNSIPFIPLISLFTILFGKRHRALHDMLTDTIVADV